MLGGIPLPRSFAPVGCDACHGMGYKGRIGIFELASVNDTVRAMIADNAAEAAIRAYYHTAGMKTMIQNGIEKIEQGVTSPEELLRVVMIEDMRGLQQNTGTSTKDKA